MTDILKKWEGYDPTPDYDPNIQALLSETDKDWGNPEENRNNLVPWGIKPLDSALYGINVVDGELNLIMGPQKKRKTTFALNVLMNIQTYFANKHKEPILVVWDTLESGMTPKRVRDTLVAMMATKYLFNHGHVYRKICPICRETVCKELGLSTEYLRYRSRTKTQAEAVKWAINEMNKWRLMVYGASLVQGNTRDLDASLRSKLNRWAWLKEVHGAVLFFSDHLQQYSFSGDPSDYEKQIRSTAAIGDFVSQYNAATILLSQVSLTSQKESNAGNGKLNAAGGTKAQQEANVSMSVDYPDNGGYMKVSIEESRKSHVFKFYQALDDTSGLFYGETAKSSTELGI